MLLLNQPVFRARLKEAHATLKHQKEVYAEAVRELERAQEMYDRTMLSEHDLQMAKNNKVKARAAQGKAESELAIAPPDLRQALGYDDYEAAAKPYTLD